MNAHMLHQPLSTMQQVSFQQSNGIPKHLSPETANSAPQSQEAAHPGVEAKTDDVIESVARGASETRLPNPTVPNHGMTPSGLPPHMAVTVARQQYLLAEIKAFDEIFRWYQTGIDQVGRCAAIKERMARKRPRQPTEELQMEPELKKLIFDLEECAEIKMESSANGHTPHIPSPLTVNPLKRMEMMTHSPVFEPARINNITGSLSASKREASGTFSYSACVASPSSSSSSSSASSLLRPPYPSHLPAFPSSSHYSTYPPQIASTTTISSCSLSSSSAMPQFPLQYPSPSFVHPSPQQYAALPTLYNMPPSAYARAAPPPTSFLYSHNAS